MAKWQGCQRNVSHFFIDLNFWQENTDTILPNLTEISVGTQNALMSFK